MEKSKHTKGPWQVEIEHIVARNVKTGKVQSNGANSVAKVYGPDALANARLIAAAPELLEAVISIAHAIDTLPRRLTRREYLALNQARAAIAKATQD